MPVKQLLHDPVLIILLAASLVSWAIIFDRLLALRRARREDASFRQGKETPGSALARLHAELRRHDGADRDHLLTVMDAAITLQRERLEKALPLLGVIGSTAPYMGLLGTVIGIIQAFQAIQTHNNMNTSTVSGGIATALVATAMGLAVAIPSVAAHHLLTSGINRMVTAWEAAVTGWLPERAGKEAAREPVSLA
ncbi:MAG: MotA/TolQ/ExbB proton channel family protein [Armatimonadota bacterium]